MVWDMKSWHKTINVKVHNSIIGIEAARYEANAVAAGNQVNKNELIVTRLLCRSHRAKQKERVV